MRLVVAALLFAAASPLAAQIVTKPVSFARGASSATINGSIKGYQVIDYTVNARAGQTLTVAFKPSNASAYFNIMPPGSQDVASFIGSTQGNNFSGPITADGNTTIRVYLMRNAARRNEVAKYTLNIGVTGGSSDALVPGTSYHATATIRCTAEPEKPLTGCKAGVKRSGPGNADVTVSTPDGGSRTITIRGGDPVSANGGGAIRFNWQGDTMIVRIGEVEVYEIPTALINGG